jgi:hypothetical protein
MAKLIREKTSQLRNRAALLWSHGVSRFCNVEKVRSRVANNFFFEVVDEIDRAVLRLLRGSFC